VADHTPQGQQPGSTVTGLRKFTQLHEDQRVISAWQGLAGPALKWLTPARRRLILAAGAVFFALKGPAREMLKAGGDPEAYAGIMSAFIVTGLFFALLWSCYRASLKFSALPAIVRSNPQLSLHMLFWLLLALIWNISPDALTLRMVLTGLAIQMPFFLWRIGYMILSAKRGKTAGTRFTDHLIYLWPFYGSNTPYGKGLDYLSRFEAKDETELAKSQLAGIKLLILSVIWNAANEVLNAVAFGVDNPVKHALGGLSLNLPHLKQLINRTQTASIGMSWLCLYSELFRDVLSHAIKGHVIIGVARIFGFNVFRNTYKPLLSVSVVEFWNRYYYYFKELMAELFFYPTFMGWFRKNPVLRLFAAVFMAAFVGNMYYHLIKMPGRLAMGNFQELWDLLHPRLFYCFLLSMGIFLSMLREQKNPGRARSGGHARQGIAIFGVWTFFSVISIWNQKNAGSFIEVTRFFFGILGIS